MAQNIDYDILHKLFRIKVDEGRSCMLYNDIVIMISYQSSAQQ